MRNVFRLRLETPEGFQNQLFTFLDAGDRQDDTRIAVLAEWHDRRVQAVAEPVLRQLTRDYDDLQTPAGAFLEDFVLGLDVAGRALPDDQREAYELGVVLCRGRSLYVLHTRGLQPLFSLGGPPQPLQSTLRLRVKELPLSAHAAGGEGEERHVRLQRVFFEDEDRIVLWLDGSDFGVPSRQERVTPDGESSDPEPARARIVLLKEAAPDSEAVETLDSDWPHAEEAPKRDRTRYAASAMASIGTMTVSERSRSRQAA